MAGEAYDKRYPEGFVDNDDSKPVDAQFLNAVESALMRLLAVDPSDDGIPVWDAGLGRFKFQKLANAQIDPAAAIDKSKLGSLAITDSDVAAGAGITQSKLSLAFPAARVRNNAAISVPNASTTALTFNTERFDNDEIHDVISNTDRLTCKTAGLYLIFGHVNFAQNATGRRQLSIGLNGTSVVIASQLVNAVTTSDPTQLSISTLWKMSVNDYVKLLASQSSGGALNVESIADYSPEFGMVWVGDG